MLVIFGHLVQGNYLLKIGARWKRIFIYLYSPSINVSMLSPEEFGTYYAVGSSKNPGTSHVFEVDPNYRNPYFHMDEALKRCVPHEDGRPKASIYVSVYRVLEHIDPDALLDLYLTTQDGRTLGLKASDEFLRMKRASSLSGSCSRHTLVVSPDAVSF